MVMTTMMMIKVYSALVEVYDTSDKIGFSWCLFINIYNTDFLTNILIIIQQRTHHALENLTRTKRYYHQIFFQQYH
jgi:hypothetical protein